MKHTPSFDRLLMRKFIYAFFTLFFLFVSLGQINSQPNVTSVTPSVGTIFDGTATFSIAVTFDVAMNTGVNPTVSFGTAGENPVADGVLTATTTAWSNGDKTFTQNYSVSDINADKFNIDVDVDGGEDTGGTSHGHTDADNNFGYKMTNPTVTPTLSPNITLIDDSDAGNGTFTITIDFSEGMDNGVNPIVSFPTTGEDPAATITTFNNAWLLANQYIIRYTVTDNDENIQNIDVRVAGAQDTYGNPVQQYDEADVFSIDMQNPTISSVTPSVTVVDDGNVGAASFSLTIVYDQDMNTGTNPTISYPTAGENPEASSFTVSSTSWLNNTTFQIVYNVADANENIPDIDVRITGAEDPNGNVQPSTDEINSFSVDTENPSVSAVNVNINPITDANTGAETFVITIDYNQDMAATPVPNINFPVENPTSTISFSSGSWSGTTTYLARYDVSDANQDLTNIDIEISAATDDNGNTQIVSTNNDQFDIAMNNPAVTGITPAPATLTDADAGAGNFTITVNYDEPMTVDGSADPAIDFPNENPATTLFFFSDLWNTNQQYVATYDVNDGNQYLQDIDVRVTAGKDADGNTQTQYDIADNFDIDMSNPVVSSVTPNLTNITDANVGAGTFTLTIVYDKPMNTGQDPTVSFPTENPTNTIGGVAYAWLNATTCRATYDVGDNNELVQNVDVRVMGAEDANNNTQTQYDESDVFSIDTENPTITGVTPGIATILDSHAAGTFTVTVNFIEIMDTGNNPAISFPNEFPGSTLSFSSGSWTSNTSYEGVYNITDANQTLADIDIRVSGAEDASGNTQNPNPVDYADQFSIEMTNASVTNLTTNLLTITDGDVGAANFLITVDFDEQMNTGVAPTFTFPAEDPNATLTLAAASNWPDNDTYEAYYNVTDANEDVLNIDIRVTNATDVAGNTMNQYDEINVFSIDMYNAPPTFSSVAITTGRENEVYTYNVSTDLSFTLSSAPAWLAGGLTDNGNGTAVLSGTPLAPGTYNVVLVVEDTEPASSAQNFNIIVADAIVVDPGGGGDYTTISTAITNASAGDKIIVNDGTYNENISINKNVDFEAAISGNAILTGDGTTCIVRFDGVSSIYFDGFIIEGGQGLNTDPAGNLLAFNSYYGGGVVIENSDLTISNTIIRNNIAPAFISINNGNSGGSGGGMYCVGSTITLQNVDIYDNQAEIYRGGGICADNCVLSLDNVDITNNSGGNYGGGLFAYRSTINITAPVNIQSNNVSGENASGGGIFLLYSTIGGGATISGNSSSRYGIQQYIFDAGGETTVP
jgi:hypothetical protein